MVENTGVLKRLLLEDCPWENGFAPRDRLAYTWQLMTPAFNSKAKFYFSRPKTKQWLPRLVFEETLRNDAMCYREGATAQERC
jgi:hypothetical protein